MKYQSLNVLNKKRTLEPFDADVVSQMEKAICSRNLSPSERKQVIRALKKTENIVNAAQGKLDRATYDECVRIVDSDFVHFTAALGLVMYEDYRWREGIDNDHGQISSMFDRLNKKLEKYKNKGYDTYQLCLELYTKTGIQIYSDKEIEQGVVKYEDIENE